MRDSRSNPLPLSCTTGLGCVHHGCRSRSSSLFTVATLSRVSSGFRLGRLLVRLIAYRFRLGVRLHRWRIIYGAGWPARPRASGSDCAPLSLAHP